MKYDLERHKLLSILHIKTLMAESEQLADGESIGVSFESLEKEMECDRIKLNLFASELFSNKEIGFVDDYIVRGLFCDKNGIIAFSNRKYYKRYFKDIKVVVKDYLMILVSILSLITATLTLVFLIINKDNKPNQPQITIEKVVLIHREAIRTDDSTSTLNCFLMDSLLLKKTEN